MKKQSTKIIEQGITTSTPIDEKVLSKSVEEIKDSLEFLQRKVSKIDSQRLKSFIDNRNNSVLQNYRDLQARYANKTSN